MIGQDNRRRNEHRLRALAWRPLHDGVFGNGIEDGSSLFLFLLVLRKVAISRSLDTLMWRSEPQNEFQSYMRPRNLQDPMRKKVV